MKTNKTTCLQLRKSLFGFILTAAIFLTSFAMAEDTPPNRLPSFPDWQCLYVGDFSKACIYKITSDKKVSVYAKGTPAPDNIFFDEQGVLYVAGGDGVRTVTPTPDGSPATKENGHVKVLVDGLHNVHGVTYDKKGNLWIGQYLGADTGKKNEIGQRIFEPGFVYIRSSDGKMRMVCRESVYSMTTSPDGDVYISVLLGCQFIKITEDGTKTVVAKDFSRRGAIFDKDGTAYAIGPPGGVRKLTKDGQNTLLVDFKADGYGAMHPYSVVIDANGNFYQSDQALDHTTNPRASEGFIYQFGPAGGKRSVFLRVGDTPAFMAFWPTKRPQLPEPGTEGTPNLH